MSGSSEEKNLPASARKLLKERRKGHIAKAPDMQSAIVTIALVGWLLAQGSTVAQQFGALVDAASHAVTLDFGQAIDLMAVTVRATLVRCALVPLLVAVLAAVLGSLLINGGFLFAIESVMPKFDKLNPINGFKTMFKPKNFVELGVSIVKAILFGAILAALAWGTLGDLVRMPELGPEALPRVVRALMLPMLGAACACYAVAGIMDILLQRALFLKEMRMTQTEAKNERKETLGNPQIKMQRNRINAENRRNPVKLGPRQATLMICGDDLCVGLRYRPGETPVPRIVCKARGERAQAYRDIAYAANVPVRWQHDLARDLDQAFKPGMTINSAFFGIVARAIQGKA